MAKKQKETDPEHYFSLCTGVMIKDIKELAFALDYLNDEEFQSHVNEQRNDFSKWIKDIFEEDQLAKNLLTKQDRKEFQIALLKHIAGKVH